MEVSCRMTMVSEVVLKKVAYTACSSFAMSVGEIVGVDIVCSAQAVTRSKRVGNIKLSKSFFTVEISPSRRRLWLEKVPSNNNVWIMNSM